MENGTELMKAPESSGVVQIEQHRAIQEVQASMIIALSPASTSRNQFSKSSLDFLTFQLCKDELRSRMFEWRG